MKKLLLYILNVLLFVPLFSQSIKNTTWKTYNSGFSDTITVVIKTDTIEQFIGDDSLLVSSWFAEYHDTIVLLDITGPLMCTNPDTGLYRVAVTGDTMVVDLITDPCIPRGINYDGAILWKEDLPSGFYNHKNLSAGIKMFPNPTKGIVYFTFPENGILSIFNYSGHEVVRVENQGFYQFSCDLKSGLYIARFSGLTSQWTGKLMVE